MDPKTLNQATGTQGVVNQQNFAINIQNAIKHYFSQLDGTNPSDLYAMVLAEIEIPLLKMVMRFTSNNQSKAAKILGLSRGTLRKKLAMYKLN